MSTTAEAPEAETTEVTNDFQATLSAAMDRANAAPPEEQEEEAEGEEQEQEDAGEAESAVVEAPKEEPKPAAPVVSPEWLSEAVRLGVPREVLRFARSNDDVQAMIVDFGDEPQREAAPPVPEFPLSADEFDATDPTHKAIKAMWDQNQQLQGVITKLTQSTTGLISERQQSAILAREAEYDAGLDALNMPELGARGSQIRKDSWSLFESLIERNPGVSKSELAKRAVFGTHPELLTQQATQQQLEAIKGQQHRTMGAGSSKPPAKKEPTPRDNFLATLDAAHRRAERR